MNGFAVVSRCGKGYIDFAAPLDIGCQFSVSFFQCSVRDVQTDMSVSRISAREDEVEAFSLPGDGTPFKLFTEGGSFRAVDGISVFLEPGTDFAENIFFERDNRAVSFRSDVQQKVASMGNNIDQLRSFSMALSCTSPRCCQER